MKRYHNLSLYRLGATFCILAFHIFFIMVSELLVYEVLLSKCLQGLTALSGFLMSQKVIENKKDFYLSRFKRILVPALLVIVLMMVWNLIHMLIVKDYNYFSLFTGTRAYNGRLLIQPGNYYFIVYIAICYLITPLLQKKNVMSIAVAIGVLLLEFALFTRLSDPLFIVTSYVVGYFVGSYSFKYYVDKSTKFSALRLLIWLTILLISILGYVVMIRNGTAYKVGPYRYQIPRNVFLSMFGVSSMFVFILVFRFINFNINIKVFKYTDNLTYIVYLLNQAFMIGGMNVTNYVSDFAVKITLVILFTIVFSVLILFVSDLIEKRVIKKYKSILSA